MRLSSDGESCAHSAVLILHSPFVFSAAPTSDGLLEAGLLLRPATCSAGACSSKSAPFRIPAFESLCCCVLQFGKMQAAASLSLASSPSSATASRSARFAEYSVSDALLRPFSSLSYCGLRREVLASRFLNRHCSSRTALSCARRPPRRVSAAASDNGGAAKGFDYDLLIIGAGVGGHGAAIHAVERVRLTSLCSLDSVGFRFFCFDVVDCTSKLYDQILSILG